MWHTIYQPRRIPNRPGGPSLEVPQPTEPGTPVVPTRRPRTASGDVLEAHGASPPEDVVTRGAVALARTGDERLARRPGIARPRHADRRVGIGGQAAAKKPEVRGVRGAGAALPQRRPEHVVLRSARPR